MMRAVRLLSLVLFSISLGACAAKAQVRTEAEIPLLNPPPAPPRVVAAYEAEPEPVLLSPPVEAAAPVRPAARPPRIEPPKPETAIANAPEPAEPARPAPPPPSLTLTPSPGSEQQTVAAIRDLLTKAGRDLARVNAASLNADGRTQFDQARRFLQQAEDALKAKNIVFAGKLADKAATMAAVLVR
jgi:hypothetical protein